MEQITRQDATSRSLMWFWWGLIIYNIGFCGNDLELSWLYKLGAVVGIPVAMVALLRQVRWGGREINNLSKTYFYVLLAWSLFMWLNSESKMLFNVFEYLYSYNVLPYTCILLLMVPTVSLVRSFYTFAYRSYKWYLFVFFIPLFFPWQYGIAQMFYETLVASSLFIFLTNKYHSSRTLISAVVCLVLTFLVATINARRNLMLTTALYMMVGSFTYVFGTKIKSLENKIVIIFGAVLFMMASLYVFITDSSGAFSLIMQRASENTREGVLVSFMLDMDTTSDWSVGRGMFGTYYCPGVDGEGTEDRGAIECGYLQFILKGGCIYLLLYVVTFITAIIRGFRSCNQLCKASAWILLIQIVDLFPFGIHAFNTKTYLIWMAVAICLSSDLRRKSDDEIAAIFFERTTPLLPWQKN